MSTHTALGSVADLSPVEARPARPSLFRRFLTAMMKSREEQALRYVSSHLARYSDEQLLQLGFGKSEIREIRERGTGSTSYWI